MTRRRTRRTDRLRAAPLPDRDGIPPMRFHLPIEARWTTVAEFVLDHTHRAPGVRERLEAGEVLLDDGSVVRPDTPYRGGRFVFLYRDLPPEPAVPGEVEVLHDDPNILVVDKPHFLATMPRGSHVAETVLVRLRRRFGLAELAPAHRLDRLTAGVMLLTKRREVRGAYQDLFARRRAAKEYLAVAPGRDDLSLPTVVRSRIVKRRGTLQAIEVPGEPNAVTHIAMTEPMTGPGTEARRLYRLTPETGRTHQLRVHMAGLGIPIVGDPLYPTVLDVPSDDFSHPLQLLAFRLSFIDPLSGERRVFTARRRLGGVGGATGAAVADGRPGHSRDRTHQ